jgi:serine/threonine-protein kinase
MERLSIEGYEIGAPIGSGGVGTVYVARRASSGTRAAVRVLDNSTQPARQRSALFLNEALAASAIGHPSIIDVVDVGELADGRPYLVRDLLEGESLAERLRRVDRLPAAEVVDFARQAASALAAAHQEGIVHGAVTPETLFLIADLSLPRGERVKLLDFGMSRLHAEVPTGDRAAYLAPEQRLSGATVDERADVYSLGAVMYRALCGSPPPADGDERAAFPRALRRHIPAQVAAAVLRALSPRPDERFPSMGALVAAFDAEPPLQPRRGRRGFFLGGATLAAVIAVVLWSGPGALYGRARAVVASWLPDTQLAAPRRAVPLPPVAPIELAPLPAAASDDSPRLMKMRKGRPARPRANR